jgi:hypothetical protein
VKKIVSKIKLKAINFARAKLKGKLKAPDKPIFNKIPKFKKLK